MRDIRETTRDRRALLKGIGAAIFSGAAVGGAGAVERAGATGSQGTGSRAAAQEVDTSLPPGVVLFDLDGDEAYDATVERAPESLADDAHPEPIRITSGGLATVDYAASVVEPEDRPALGDLDRLAYDYRVGPGDGNGAGSRAFGAASGGGAVAGQNETTDSDESDDEGQTTESDEDTESGETTEDGDPGDGTETAGPGDGADGGNGDSDEGGTNDGGGSDGSGNGNDESGSGNDEGGNTGNAGNGDAAAVPDETFIVVETDEGRHGAYLTYHDEEAAEGWRTHDVLARITGDTAGTSGWFEYTADDGETFDDAIARFGADARLVRVGVGRGDGVTPTTLDAVYGGLVVNDERYRFPVEVARRSGGAPFRDAPFRG